MALGNPTIFDLTSSMSQSFGEDRVMFGSDWPVCLLAGSYAEAVNALRTVYVTRDNRCSGCFYWKFVDYVDKSTF